MTIYSSRTPFSFITLALLLLVGCDDAATTAESDWLSHPFTWDEWVERESSERAGFKLTQFAMEGLPNMDNWRAEDFLPADYLAETHAGVCTLPQEERHDVYSMARRIWGDERPESLRNELALARQGFMEPQARMGIYCSPHLNAAYLEPGALTPAEALDWTRRAAASENPRAMYRLADCMLKIAREQEAFEAATGEPLSPFWMDETYYWLRRAGFESLEILALQDLQRYTARMIGHEAKTPEEERVEMYLYSRLMELNGIFHRKPQRLGWEYVDNMSRIGSYREELIERGALAAGEARVQAWLHAYPEVWNRIYQHPMDNFQSVCPDEAGYSQRFDFDGLNEELAAYGLHVSPPSAASSTVKVRASAGN